MSKPVLIIRIPSVLKINKEHLHQMVEDIEKKLKFEYHVISFISPLDDSVQFECFNCENATNIDINNLKKYIETLKKIKRPEDII